jgi:hypothetical protein
MRAQSCDSLATRASALGGGLRESSSNCATTSRIAINHVECGVAGLVAHMPTG